MRLQDLITSLGGRLKQPELRLNDAGVCRLVLDRQFGISIESVEDGRGVIFYSVIGTFSDHGKEALFERLLSAQLFYGELGEGCSFGIDSSHCEILLQRKFRVQHLSEEDFYWALNEFANWAEYWLAKLREEGSLRNPRGEDQDLQAGAHVVRA